MSVMKWAPMRLTRAAAVRGRRPSVPRRQRHCRASRGASGMAAGPTVRADDSARRGGGTASPTVRADDPARAHRGQCPRLRASTLIGNLVKPSSVDGASGDESTTTFTLISRTQAPVTLSSRRTRVSSSCSWLTRGKPIFCRSAWSVTSLQS